MDAQDTNEPAATAEAGTAPLSSSLKLLRLLDAIGDTDEPFGVSQLAREVGASRSMVHRQLVTLVAAGWLENRDNGTYSLTLRAIRLGQAALRHSGLTPRIAELLAQAADTLGEVTSIGAIDGTEVSVIERGMPSRRVQVSLAHGQRFPLAESALGQVLAAYSTPGQRAALAAAGAQLASDDTLERVLSHGYATVLDAVYDPIEAVAVPVGRVAGEVRYAVSVHWPQGRTTPRAALAVLEPLARAVEEVLAVSAGLGSAAVVPGAR